MMLANKEEDSAAADLLVPEVVGMEAEVLVEVEQ